MTLNPQDLIIHSKLLLNNEHLNLEKMIVITVSYPPGVCSLKAYRITQPGNFPKKSNKI